MSAQFSNWIFPLATEHGIPLEPGAVAPMSDEEFLVFQAAYMVRSESRDKALGDYIRRNQSLFRVYQPFSESAFSVAAQIAWYLDEIVIRDPVVAAFDLYNTDREAAKNYIRERLQFLSHFRRLIESGYVLLTGPTLVDDPPDRPTELAQTLFRHREVRAKFEESTRWGFAESADGTGIAYEARLPGDFTLSMKSLVDIPSGGIWASPTIDIQNGLPPIDPKELKEKLGEDPFDAAKDLFLRQIQIPIGAAGNANKFGAALLLNRDLHSVILNRAQVELVGDKQAASIGGLNLALPFVSGVPPERLVDIRENVPRAFEDFRNRLSSIILDAVRDEDITSEHLKLRVEKEITPLVNAFDGEIKGALKRAGVLGIGVPLVSGIGLLIGQIMAVSSAVLLPIAVGGAAAGVKALADRLGIDETAKSHPAFFLWKVRKLKRR